MLLVANFKQMRNSRSDDGRTKTTLRLLNTDTVTELDRHLLPQQASKVLLLVVCGYHDVLPPLSIYFMPWYTNRIMKLDPKNSDAMSIVGDDLGNGVSTSKYHIGTVVGIDGCVYGIRFDWKRFLITNTIQSMISHLRLEMKMYFMELFLLERLCFGERWLHLCPR